jgi:hypothetical protein
VCWANAEHIDVSPQKRCQSYVTAQITHILVNRKVKTKAGAFWGNFALIESKRIGWFKENKMNRLVCALVMAVLTHAEPLRVLPCGNWSGLTDSNGWEAIPSAGGDYVLMR